MPPGSFSVLTQADLYWWYSLLIQTGDSPDKATDQLNANASKLEQSSTRPAAVTARNPPVPGAAGRAWELSQSCDTLRMLRRDIVETFARLRRDPLAADEIVVALRERKLGRDHEFRLVHGLLPMLCCILRRRRLPICGALFAPLGL